METNKFPYGPFVFLGLLLLVVIWCGVRIWNIEVPKYIPTPTKQEQTRKSVVTGRDKENTELAVDTLRYLAQLEADSATISRLMANGKQKDKLIAELHARYSKKPTLGGCDTLVKEQKIRIDSLKVEVAEHRKDSVNKATLLKVQASHIQDRNLRIDTLSAGWEQANLDNAKLSRKTRNKNKLLKVSGAVIALLIGLVAVK